MSVNSARRPNCATIYSMTDELRRRFMFCEAAGMNGVITVLCVEIAEDEVALRPQFYEMTWGLVVSDGSIELMCERQPFMVSEVDNHSVDSARPMRLWLTEEYDVLEAAGQTLGVTLDGSWPVVRVQPSS